MKKFTLKQLQYFEALAEQRHFGRAADISSISQPALSVQIKELEHALGAPLFERRPREARLTSFGQKVAPRIAAILKASEDLQGFARAESDGLGLGLRIGIIPTIAPYLLPKILNTLATQHPGVDLHVRETLTERLLAELEDGQLDLAMIALPIDDNAFEEIRLFTEPLLLVRPQRDAGTPIPAPSDLAALQLLMLEEGHCFREQALSFCNMRSHQTHHGLAGTSLSTLVQMVGAGIGLTLIPEMARQIETTGAEVTVDAFPDPQPERAIGLVWRKHSPLQDRYFEIAETLKTAALNCAPA